MKNRYILIFLILMLALLLTGCNKTGKEKSDNTLDIVTSFYPMYIATSNIIDGADNVTLKILASPDVGCLHDYQLTVKDMMTLENAEVFVINGGGMESFLDKAISNYPNLKIVNAFIETESGDELEEHNEEEKHHDEEDHNHSHNHEDDVNAHIWVSVSLYIEQVEKICDGLKSIDSENAELYEKNKNIYVSKLEKLKEEMHQKLDSVEKKNIVTFHEAFYYFAKEFGLNIVAVIEREPGTSPSAGELVKIIKEIESKDVNAIFVEPQYLKTAANTISSETGISVYELDPIVSGNLEKDAYEEKMRKNLEVLLEALK